MKALLAVIAGYVTLGVIVLAYFSSHDRVLFPFHTGAIDPWKASAPAWVADEPANFNVGDKHTIIHPDLVFTLAQKKAGESLGWNPHNFAGLPHAANPLTAVWYPPNFLFRLGDPLRMYGVVAALHIVLAAIFAFLFLRSIALGTAASFLGGLGFAMSGWIAVHVQHSYFMHAFIWLPLGLYGIERFATGGGRRYGTVFAIAFAMSMLAGFPQTTVINAYVWAIYGTVAVLRADAPWKARAEKLGLLAAFAGLGLALSAIQWMPTIDYIREAGHHGQTLDELRADTLRPATLWHLLVPDFLGHPSLSIGPTDSFFGAWLLADGKFGAPTTNNYSERSFFPGTFLLVLAALCPLFRRRRPEIVAGAIAFFFVLAACDVRLGPISFLAALVKLPGLGFGSPMRLTQAAAFAWPVLGAVTIDRLLACARTGKRRLVIGGAFSAALVLAPMAVVVIALWAAPHYSAERFVAWLAHMGVDRLMGVAAMPLEQKIAGFLDVDPKTGYSVLSAQRLNLSILFVALASTFIFIVGAGRGRRAWLLVPIAVILIFGELGWFMARFNRPVAREGLYATRADGIDYLRTHQGDARFIRFGQTNDMSFFIPNAAQVYGLNDAQGFRALAPQSYLEYMRTVEDNPVDIGLPNLKKTSSLGRPALDLLRVKHVVAAEPIADAPWPLVFPADKNTPSAMWIYENSHILPRAFVTPKVTTLGSDREVLDAIARLAPVTDLAEHPLRTTMFASTPIDVPKPSVRTKDVVTRLPKITSDRPGRIEIELNGEFAGMLVLTEGWSPNWRVEAVRVGADLEVRDAVRADHTFLATPVDASHYRVAFVYAPPSAKVGFLVTWIAALATFATFMRWNWKRRIRQSPERSLPETTEKAE